ncbi:MAG: glycosyltransferase family 4 protein [Akkermansiaceae bacterium]|nr:glycosyltransferase family 4 protein [Verrucomicrobiales bacterium]
MKILFSSHLFPPSVGGLENVGLLLVEEFHAAGHEVRVITQTPEAALGNYPFEVLRCPTLKELLECVKWSDFVFQNNISLRTLWPLLLIRRPWMVVHHIWVERKGRFGGLKAALKKLVLRSASANIAISKAIADALPVPAVVIPDPYCEGVFRLAPRAVRNRDLIFVGRLVSAKGVDLLIEALARLRQEGITPALTIVGGGPEEAALRDLAWCYGLKGQVKFAGVRLLNQHQILVVPSRWAEPFGIVALEGIACGCVVAGSAGGGLKDAIGGCGITFENGDVAALQKALRELLLNPASWPDYRSHAAAHLARHSPPTVARAYLRLMEAETATVGIPCLKNEKSI